MRGTRRTHKENHGKSKPNPKDVEVMINNILLVDEHFKNHKGHKCKIERRGRICQMYQDIVFSRKKAFQKFEENAFSGVLGLSWMNKNGWNSKLVTPGSSSDNCRDRLRNRKPGNNKAFLKQALGKENSIKDHVFPSTLPHAPKSRNKLKGLSPSDPLRNTATSHITKTRLSKDKLIERHNCKLSFSISQGPIIFGERIDPSNLHCQRIRRTERQKNILTSVDSFNMMGWNHHPAGGKRSRIPDEGTTTNSTLDSSNNHTFTEETLSSSLSKRPKESKFEDAMSPPVPNLNSFNLPSGNSAESKFGLESLDTLLETSCHAHYEPDTTSKYYRDHHHCDGLVKETSQLAIDDTTLEHESNFLEFKIKTLGNQGPSMMRNEDINSTEKNCLKRSSKKMKVMGSIKPSPSCRSLLKLRVKNTSSNEKSCGGASRCSNEESEFEDVDEEESDTPEASVSDNTVFTSDSLDEDETAVSAAESVDVIPSMDTVKSVLPPIRLSYFPNVPPYLNFCMHDEVVEKLPDVIHKHLKWRLSTITPVVVRKTVSNSGFRLLKKTVEWTGQWGKHMKAAMFRSTLKDYQKLNHIPATFQIGRKDRLWRNAVKFMLKFGKNEFNFLPKTFVLPNDAKALKKAWDSQEFRGKFWIVKPPAGARGTGIRVVNKWNQVPKKKPVVVQSYISRPYLINERKFDLRLYVLLTSINPLRIYIYNDGLVRFAPVKYTHDSRRVGDRYMHLTNYSINKNCELYTKNEDADVCQGHKWSLKALWRYLQDRQINTSVIKKKIEEIVIKTIISAEELISSAAQNLPSRYNGYELFGFDIIFDENLKPWLLEVNISPSLHSSSSLDLAVKGPLIRETFNIVGYHVSPNVSSTGKVLLKHNLDVPLQLETPVFDRRLYTSCISKVEKQKQLRLKPFHLSRDLYLKDILEYLTPDDVRHLVTTEDELSQCIGFQRIFPSTTTHTYFKFFEYPKYYNMLLDAWEHRYHSCRIDGIRRLIELCRVKAHLQVPSVCRNTICGSQETMKPKVTINLLANTEQQLKKEAGGGGDTLAKSDVLKVTESTVDDMDEGRNRSDDPSIDTSGSISNINSQLQPQVLDNITNNSPRSLPSNGTSTIPSPSGDKYQASSNNCHDELQSEKTTMNQKLDLMKGVCY